MSLQMTWGLIGFWFAMLIVGVYHLLKTRGIRFFWYHPLFAGAFLILVLYVLESFFSNVSASELLFNWDLMLYIAVPVVIVAAFLVFRGLRRLRRGA